jgi:aminopeptidase-like protein
MCACTLILLKEMFVRILTRVLQPIGANPENIATARNQTGSDTQQWSAPLLNLMVALVATVSLHC